MQTKHRRRTYPTPTSPSAFAQCIKITPSRDQSQVGSSKHDPFASCDRAPTDDLVSRDVQRARARIISRLG